MDDKFPSKHHRHRIWSIGISAFGCGYVFGYAMLGFLNRDWLLFWLGITFTFSLAGIAISCGLAVFEGNDYDEEKNDGA